MGPGLRLSGSGRVAWVRRTWDPAVRHPVGAPGFGELQPGVSCRTAVLMFCKSLSDVSCESRRPYFRALRRIFRSFGVCRLTISVNEGPSLHHLGGPGLSYRLLVGCTLAPVEVCGSVEVDSLVADS